MTFEIVESSRISI